MYWSLLQRSWCSPLVSENPLPSCCCHLETPRIPSSWNALHALPETWCFGWNCELLFRMQLQGSRSKHWQFELQCTVQWWIKWGRFLGAPLRHRSHFESSWGNPWPGPSSLSLWEAWHPWDAPGASSNRAPRFSNPSMQFWAKTNVPCRRKHFLQQPLAPFG